MYRCLAANAVGEAEQSVRVMVERAPRPTTLPSQPRPAEEQASPSDGPCATNPCYNGGTCSPDEREPRRARCQCQPDYHGRKCQFKRRPPPVEEEEDGGVDDDDDDDSIDSKSVVLSLSVCVSVCVSVCLSRPVCVCVCVCVCVRACERE